MQNAGAAPGAVLDPDDRREKWRKNADFAIFEKRP
jgi:hypothetical protein